jgi:hypothetical protein
VRAELPIWLDLLAASVAFLVKFVQLGAALKQHHFF